MTIFTSHAVQRLRCIINVMNIFTISAAASIIGMFMGISISSFFDMQLAGLPVQRPPRQAQVASARRRLTAATLGVLPLHGAVLQLVGALQVVGRGRRETVRQPPADVCLRF